MCRDFWSRSFLLCRQLPTVLSARAIADIREPRGPPRGEDSTERHPRNEKGSCAVLGRIALRLFRHALSLRCLDREKERASEREKRREERKSVRKRAKRLRSDSLPVATDGQRRDEEPCVAKECVTPVADCGGRPGDSICGKFLE